ncbi:hypothetical protein [Enhygromyxa salina]|uniref:Uncharacterized protein n=1 Tax=Enhygromyxa salina TaxID=215803 RepID=A0A2S9YC49_9BACT|nr:hypothetical protein [Enhygromyxa salina]PRQ02673.1 hypothetical protein ENSA7_55020 [Enhygromyxa salina]
MPKLKTFDPPANQNDFTAAETQLEAALRARWSSNINMFTESVLQNKPAPTQYFNPLTTDIPDQATEAVIRWTAFPARISKTFSFKGERTQWSYADNGPPASENYEPLGPRGWQDEYCEWSVTRNDAGKITKVSFTCENREYWYTLWDISPEVVLRLYQQLVGPQVEPQDLYSRDEVGNPIINAETGRPAYNGHNKWNSTTTEGVVHLISAPNALSAEISLAGQATILRKDSTGEPITDPAGLITCSNYGIADRNSDPHIGASVNSLVRGSDGLGSGMRVSLSNPVGLYIQTPNFNQYSLPSSAPAGAQPSDCWSILRGHARGSGEAIDYILHAVFEVPEEWGFTVSDITINGFNIDFGAQITETFHIALAAYGLQPQTEAPSELTCARDAKPPLPRTPCLRDSPVLPATFRSGLSMRIEQGTTISNIGLYATDVDTNAIIAFTGAPGVSLEQQGTQATDEETILFQLTITAAADAPLGVRSVLLTNANGAKGPAVYGLLEVVAPGTLAGEQTEVVGSRVEPSTQSLGVMRSLASPLGSR